MNDTYHVRPHVDDPTLDDLDARELAAAFEMARKIYLTLTNDALADLAVTKTDQTEAQRKAQFESNGAVRTDENLIAAAQADAEALTCKLNELLIRKGR